MLDGKQKKQEQRQETQPIFQKQLAGGHSDFFTTSPDATKTRLQNEVPETFLYKKQLLSMCTWGGCGLSGQRNYFEEYLGNKTTISKSDYEALSCLLEFSDDSIYSGRWSLVFNTALFLATSLNKAGKVRESSLLIYETANALKQLTRLEEETGKPDNEGKIAGIMPWLLQQAIGYPHNHIDIKALSSCESIKQMFSQFYKIAVKMDELGLLHGSIWADPLEGIFSALSKGKRVQDSFESFVSKMSGRIEKSEERVFTFRNGEKIKSKTNPKDLRREYWAATLSDFSSAGCVSSKELLAQVNDKLDKMERLHKDFGITYFHRYSTAALENAYKTAYDPNFAKGKKLAFISFPYADWNDAFRNTGFLDELVKNNYAVIITENRTDEEEAMRYFSHGCYSRSPAHLLGRTYDFVAFGGHGTETSRGLSDWKIIDELHPKNNLNAVEVSDKELGGNFQKGSFARMISSGAVIALISCSNAGRSRTKMNMQDFTGWLFEDGKKKFEIYAPKVPAALTSISFAMGGKIKSIYFEREGATSHVVYNGSQEKKKI